MPKSFDEIVKDMELLQATPEQSRRWNDIAWHIVNDLASEVNENPIEGLNVLSVIVLIYILQSCVKGCEELAVDQFLTLLKLQFEAHMATTSENPRLN
jgi:hypothetical protein